MTRTASARFRASIVLALSACSAALAALAACTTDEASPYAPDATCALTPCLDATAGTTDGRSPGEDAPTAVDAADDGGVVQDAAPDVDPWADADPNCANYALPASGTPSSVKIQNQRDASIYLGRSKPSCDFFMGFDFRDGADASLAIAPDPSTTCTELQSASTCTSTCEIAVVTKLGPGQTYDIGWPGTLYVPRYMPPKCYADAACATGPCEQKVVAPSGTIVVTAYTGYHCDGGVCPDCTLGGAGNCIVSGALATSGTVLEGKAAYATGASTVTVGIQ